MEEDLGTVIQDSVLKYTQSVNFGLITKQENRQTTYALYSSAINISQQKEMGKAGAVFLGSSGEEFEDLRIVKKIGQGGFSEVFQAVDEKTKKEYAMRLCTIDGKNFTQERANKEIEVYNQLRHIDHPNIAKVYSAKIISSVEESKETQSLQVIMELGVCTLEDVFKTRIKNSKPWTEIELLHIAAMLVHPLLIAKEHGISHRDLSLNNVILANDLKHYKLIDFAEAKTASHDLEEIPIVGKLKYMAPEILKLMEQIRAAKAGGKSPTGSKIKIDYDPEKADVFSLGIVIGSLCCLELLDGSTAPEVYKKKLGQVQKEYPRIHSMLVDMLNPVPNLRKDLRRLHEEILSYSADMSKLQFFELEFESGLKATSSPLAISNTFEKTYQDFIRKGDFNLRNNLFGEAIMCYLKVYELVKRGEIPLKKE